METESKVTLRINKIFINESKTLMEFILILYILNSYTNRNNIFIE